MKEKTLDKFLKKYRACSDGYEFAKDLTLKEFLNTCERGDWILWLFARMNKDSLRELTLAKAHCANTVRHLMKDERSTKAIDVAIRFGNNEASRDELDAAHADATYAADAAAYATYVTYVDSTYATYATAAAAAAATFATYDPAATVYANAATVYATYATAAAAAAATYVDDPAAPAYAVDDAVAAVGKANQKLTADICRKYLPLEIWDQSKL